MQDDQNQIPNPNTQYSNQKPLDPVSSPLKEAEPFAEQPKGQDSYIEVSEKEPQIRPEVEAAGVYKVSEKIRLDQEARKAGLEEAKESANVVTTPSGKVTLPMSEVEAKENAKGNPSNSSTWIGMIIQLFLKKLGGSALGR